MIFTPTWIDISVIVGAAAAAAVLLKLFNKPKTAFAPVKHGAHHCKAKTVKRLRLKFSHSRPAQA